MTAAITNLTTLLRTMQPSLQPGTYTYCSLPATTPVPVGAIGWFRELEGVSVILPVPEATALGFAVDFELAWLTLSVHSSLEAVGLTAAVSGALAAAGISCNVVAAYYHDHLFVPATKANAALHILEQLQNT